MADKVLLRNRKSCNVAESFGELKEEQSNDNKQGVFKIRTKERKSGSVKRNIIIHRFY